MVQLIQVIKEHATTKKIGASSTLQKHALFIVLNELKSDKSPGLLLICFS